jgi:hypothetical protein
MAVQRQPLGHLTKGKWMGRVTARFENLVRAIGWRYLGPAHLISFLVAVVYAIVFGNTHPLVVLGAAGLAITSLAGLAGWVCAPARPSLAEQYLVVQRLSWLFRWLAGAAMVCVAAMVSFDLATEVSSAGLTGTGFPRTATTVMSLAASLGAVVLTTCVIVDRERLGPGGRASSVATLLEPLSRRVGPQTPIHLGQILGGYDHRLLTPFALLVTPLLLVTWIV